MKLLRSKHLARDIRLHFYAWGTVRAYDHLVLLAARAARQYGIWLTYEQVFAAESLLLDHKQLNDKTIPSQKRMNMFMAALTWIGQREPDYFCKAKPLDLKLDGFPLDVSLIQ